MIVFAVLKAPRSHDDMIYKKTNGAMNRIDDFICNKQTDILKMKIKSK